MSTTTAQGNESNRDFLYCANHKNSKSELNILCLNPKCPQQGLVCHLCAFSDPHLDKCKNYLAPLRLIQPHVDSYHSKDELRKQIQDHLRDFKMLKSRILKVVDFYERKTWKVLEAIDEASDLKFHDIQEKFRNNSFADQNEFQKSVRQIINNVKRNTKGDPHQWVYVEESRESSEQEARILSFMESHQEFSQKAKISLEAIFEEMMTLMEFKGLNLSLDSLKGHVERPKSELILPEHEKKAQQKGVLTPSRQKHEHHGNNASTEDTPNRGGLNQDQITKVHGGNSTEVLLGNEDESVKSERKKKVPEGEEEEKNNNEHLEFMKEELAQNEHFRLLQGSEEDTKSQFQTIPQNDGSHDREIVPKHERVGEKGNPQELEDERQSFSNIENKKENSRSDHMERESVKSDLSSFGINESRIRNFMKKTPGRFEQLKCSNYIYVLQRPEKRFDAVVFCVQRDTISLEGFGFYMPSALNGNEVRVEFKIFEGAHDKAKIILNDALSFKNPIDDTSPIGKILFKAPMKLEIGKYYILVLQYLDEVRIMYGDGKWQNVGPFLFSGVTKKIVKHLLGFKYNLAESDVMYTWQFPYLIYSKNE